MKTKDIKSLPVSDLADEACWLFLWVTNNFLKDGLEVMGHWGFDYVTNLVWAKNTIGLGYYFRGHFIFLDDHKYCMLQAWCIAELQSASVTHILKVY